MRRSKNIKVAGGIENPVNAAIGSRDAQVIDMVREAIAHKQTLLAYQPVMVASEPGRVGYYEGLIRVMDETGRIIPATDFMPVVENTSLGRDIDVLALSMGLHALHGNPGLRLAINMSARSIGYGRWLSTLKRWLNKDRSLGERLIMEITESSAMDQPELTLDFMDQVSHHGVCFALDDFGSGHTALRYLSEFLFDIVKIDRLFCHGVARNADNQALVKAMVSLARHFDMLVVAEGVERADDVAFLTSLDVDCLQGYYFEAPTTRPVWMRQSQGRTLRRGNVA